MKGLLLISFLALALNVPTPARAEGAGKEFFTSVIYGTIAGTLVGAATLAFTDNPGDNLGNIARGASLGLYAGIILGFYVSNVSNENPDGDTKQAPADETPKESAPTPDTPSSRIYPSKTQEPLYGFSLFPLVDKNSMGVGANLVRLHF